MCGSGVLWTSNFNRGPFSCADSCFHQVRMMCKTSQQAGMITQECSIVKDKVVVSAASAMAFGSLAGSSFVVAYVPSFHSSEAMETTFPALHEEL